MLNNRKQCGMSMSSSLLTHYHRNKAIYVNYATQQERFNHGCQSRIVFNNNGGGFDSSVFTGLNGGCIHNIGGKNGCIITNDCIREESIVPVTPSVPSAPIILSIIPGGGTLTVIFTPPSDDGGSPITDYEYSTDNGVTFVSGGTTVSPLTISGLINETTYQVVIRAVNLNGPGVKSNIVSKAPSLDNMIINITTALPNSIMSLPFSGLNPSIIVDWGDGNIVTYNSTPILKTYVNPGNYIISVTGGAFGFGEDGGPAYTGAEYITGVIQWGTLGIISLNGAFSGAKKLVLVPSNVPIGVTSMRFMFRDAQIFNQDISGWDVGLVTTMAFMFENAFLFNQNLSNWDVTNVSNMTYMFFNAQSFNQPIIWLEKTINVTNMRLMFSNAINFNQDISNWNVTNVTTMDGMFNNAISFNTLPDWKEKTINVTDMGFMFYNAINFNQDLSDWNVTNVTNMAFMFYNAISFNILPDWKEKTINVTSMNRMFGNATIFNQDLSDWNVTNVIDMSFMFSATTNFNTLPNWGTKTANVKNMSYMFNGAINFNQDISGWDVGNVTDMSVMFASATNFNQDLSSWDVTNVTNMDSMFAFATNFNTLPDWKEKTINVKNMNGMFFNATTFNQDLSDWNISNVETMFMMFSTAISFNILPNWGIKTANVKNMSYMFNGATNFNQDISGWDVGNVTDMNFMFASATNFNQDLSAWDVSKVTTMVQMFDNATSFNSPLIWGIKTISLTNIAGMFGAASNFNQDISGWDVSNVKNMAFMFYTAPSFNNGGMPFTWGIKTQNVTDMAFMFYGATNFNSDISNWNVTNVISMARMFNASSIFDQDLSSWTATALIDALNIFCGCPMLGQTAKYPPKLIILGQNYGC